MAFNFSLWYNEFVNQEFGEMFVMAMWNPWRGCKKCSEGCLHCYIHKGDAKRGVNTNDTHKTKDFYKPTEKLKNGNYKMKAGLVYLCFSTDFLIEEADDTHGAEVYLMDDKGSAIKGLSFRLPPGNTRQMHFSQTIVFRFEDTTILQSTVSILGDHGTSNVNVAEVNLLIKKIHEQ